MEMVPATTMVVSQGFWIEQRGRNFSTHTGESRSRTATVLAASTTLYGIDPYVEWRPCSTPLCGMGGPREELSRLRGRRWHKLLQSPHSGPAVVNKRATLFAARSRRA